MILTSLRVNQMSPAGFDWYLSYLGTIDRAQIPSLLLFLHEDCDFQINNHLPLHGRTAIGAAFERYWDAIESIEHDLLNIYGDDHRFAVEMLCHYTRRDGSKIILPAAAFIDRAADGLILMARSYIDATPVHDAFTRKFA